MKTYLITAALLAAIASPSLAANKPAIEDAISEQCNDVVDDGIDTVAMKILGPEKVGELVRVRATFEDGRGKEADDAVSKLQMKWVMSGEVDGFAYFDAIADVMDKASEAPVCRSATDSFILFNMGNEITEWLKKYGAMLKAAYKPGPKI